MPGVKGAGPARLGLAETPARAVVTGHVGTERCGELAGLELLIDLTNRARTADRDGDIRGRERLVRIGPAVARQDVLNALVGHELGGLDSGPAALGDVGVLHRLEAQVVRFDDEEERTPPEARVHFGIQVRCRGCDRDFHV